MALRDYEALDEEDYYGQAFACEGFVSLWFSDTPADEFEPGTDSLQDLAGVGYYDPDDQEVIVADGSQPVPIADLLRQLSWSDSFAETATRAAQRSGHHSALWVLAQYDFIYDPRRVKRPVSPALRYLGVLPYASS